MNDPILPGIQAGMDREQPGWLVTNYVVVIGATRINDEGQVENTSGVLYADGQADYTTKGLLNKGYDLIEEAEEAAKGYE